MVLTEAQQVMIKRLQKATRIVRAVTWYMQYPGTNRVWSSQLDTRVCMALVRRGILVKADTNPSELGEYKLADEYIP